MSLEWTKERTEALISLYQQNQCLYDPSHYLYRDRVERKKTISYIATVLQTTENSVTCKIKNLRSQLWRERWKEQYREINGTEDRGKWWLKDSLKFLEPFLVLKPTNCCLQLEDGQALQSEVSPGSETNPVQADFNHQNNIVRTNLQHIDIQHDIKRQDLPQLQNDISDQSSIKDLYNEQENNQITEEDFQHQVDLNNLQEIDKLEDDTDNTIEGNVTRNDPTRFISNYPTGIFRNDFVFDNRSSKGKYNQQSQRMHRNLERIIDPEITTKEGQSSDNMLIEKQQGSNCIPTKNSLTTASSLSHTEVLNHSTSSPLLERRQLSHERLFKNSKKKSVGKYKANKRTRSFGRSVKQSWKIADEDYDNNRDEGNMLVQAVSCVERVSNRLALEDQFTVFGKHVANELRSVASLDAQRWARMKIQNILYEAQTAVNPSLMHRNDADISEKRHSSTNNGTVQSTSID